MNITFASPSYPQAHSIPVGPVPAGMLPGRPSMNTAAPEPMGVHVHCYTLGGGFPLVNEQDLNMIQAAGFRKVRMDILWQEVEKQPGVYDFRKYDWIMQGLVRRGIRPMVILGLGNPLYGQGLTLYPPGAKEAFERYAMATVNRYKGQGVIWEIVNEPNHPDFWQPVPNPDHYMALVRGLLPKLRAIDPSGFYVAPSTAGAPVDFLTRCFQQGLLSLVDGVGIHPYQAFPTNRPPEAFETEYRQVRQLMDIFSPTGKQIPIILGEWGYSTAQGELDKQTQADYAVRQALLGMMVGSPLNIWYDWKGDILSPGFNRLKKEENFGLVDAYLRPKPAYFALQAMTRALQGQTFMRRLPSINPQDFLLLFSSGPRSSVAAWTTGLPHSVAVEGRDVLLTGRPSYLPLSTVLFG